MFKKAGSKYGDILTMLLVVLIVVILGIVGYFGYDMYNRSTKTANAETAMAEFEEATKSVRKKKVTNTVGEETDTNPEEMEIVERENISNGSASDTEVQATASDGEKPPKVMYEGYEMLGKISIPKIKCEYPVLAETTKHSIEVAVAVLYPTNLEALNLPGNTVIVGHNYRNGMFFSNNHKLSNGDLIHLTSATETVTYEIYNMYYTSPNDAEYMKRDTGGGREISLSTCNDDSSSRLVIWAKEKI